MQNPYLTIWTKPKATFEQFFREGNANSIFGLPFVVYGVSVGLSIAQDIFSLLGANSNIATMLSVYLFASLMGIGFTYLFLAVIQPWIFKLIGKIWNGEATRSKIANVNALAAIPYCLILLYQLVLLTMGKEPTRDSVNPVFQYALWIFSIRILIIGLSVAQKYNYGIAVLNLFLSMLPLIILGFLINN